MGDGFRFPLLHRQLIHFLMSSERSAAQMSSLFHTSIWVWVKVSYSQNDFLVSSIFQKSNAKNEFIFALEFKKWSNDKDKDTLLC